MRLLLSKTLTVCSMTVFPATLKNCLGVPSPEREPTPPARTGNDLIRKTDKAKITITPISPWADVRIDVFDEELEKIITPIPSV